jgi:hypothetical protein
VYPFVRLHQPAAWYGVASRVLERSGPDCVGVNKGMCTLSSGAEVLAYFDAVMRERFLPSGRVTFMPMCEYEGELDGSNLVRSLTSGATRKVVVRRKIVDAHARAELPSTHPPKYEVDPGVVCVPVNELPRIRRPYSKYTVVGSGKTGMDACIWLLENGVSPEHIRWIRPREAWYIDRGLMQPTLDGFEPYMDYLSAQFDAMATAKSLDDLLARLEAAGALVRLDAAVEPTMFRCATVSKGELAMLRSIEDVVRLGHARRLRPTEIELDSGNLPADIDTLYIDCSACGVPPKPRLPVFEAHRINLLLVRFCGHPTLSAALIAYVESHYDDDARKNRICQVVPVPERPADWLNTWAGALSSMTYCQQEQQLNAWLARCRLNPAAAMMRAVSPEDTARQAKARLLGPKIKAAAAAVPALRAMLKQKEAAA